MTNATRYIHQTGRGKHKLEWFNVKQRAGKFKNQKGFLISTANEEMTPAPVTSGFKKHIRRTLIYNCKSPTEGLSQLMRLMYER